MQHLLAKSVCLLAVASVAGGCFATKIQSGSKRPGATHTHRQWFTLSGLVPLSGAAGSECGEGGVSYAESRQGVVDVLLSTAIAVGTASVGFAACNDDDSEEYASCVSAFTGLGGVLLGSRTVEYQCTGGTAAARLEPLHLGE